MNVLRVSLHLHLNTRVPAKESKARLSSTAPAASLEGGRADMGGAYWSLSPLLGKEAVGRLYGLSF